MAEKLTGHREAPSANIRRKWRFALVFAAGAFALVLLSLATLRSRHPSSQSVEPPRVSRTPSSETPTLENAATSKTSPEPSGPRLLVATLVLEPGTTRGIERPA